MGSTQGLQGAEFDGVEFICEYDGEHVYANRAAKTVNLTVSWDQWDRITGLPFATGKALRCILVTEDAPRPQRPKPKRYTLPDLSDLEKAEEELVREAFRICYEMLRTGTAAMRVKFASSLLAQYMGSRKVVPRDGEDPLDAKLEALLRGDYEPAPSADADAANPD